MEKNEERQFTVKIIVTDEQGSDLERNFNYSPNTNYSESVHDMVETHLEAENICDNSQTLEK